MGSHPRQPGLIFTSWWDVLQKSAIATLCVLCGLELASDKITGIVLQSLQLFYIYFCNLKVSIWADMISFPVLFTPERKIATQYTSSSKYLTAVVYFECLFFNRTGIADHKIFASNITLSILWLSNASLIVRGFFQNWDFLRIFSIYL